MSGDRRFRKNLPGRGEGGRRDAKGERGRRAEQKWSIKCQKETTLLSSSIYRAPRGKKRGRTEEAGIPENTGLKIYCISSNKMTNNCSTFRKAYAVQRQGARIPLSRRGEKKN